METRAIEIRASADGRVTGTAVRYDDVAPASATGHGMPERFERASLLPDAPALNFMHDRQVTIAPSVSLIARPESMDFEARLDDKYSDTIRGLVASGLIKGASIEFRAMKERVESGIRVIELARLESIALVDIPAYRQSAIEMRRGDDSAAYPSSLEYRNTTGVIAGVIRLGVPGITSLARRRKVLIPKDADLGIADDVIMIHGVDYNDSLASSAAGSLIVTRTENEIRFATVNSKLARTAAYRDVHMRIAAGLLKGARPGLQIIDSDKHIDTDGYTVERVRRGGVCEVYLTARSGDDYSGQLNGRRRRRGF